MKLPWREVLLDTTYFSTSITKAEADVLARFAKNRSVLEVGTAYGYSACLMAYADARLVLTVDPHHGYGSMTGSLSMAINHVRHMGLEDRVQIVVAKSESFLPRLNQAGAMFDMAFIDGDHRFDAVEADVENAWRMLRPGGIMAIHDYGEETCPDVRVAIEAMFGPPDQWKYVDLIDTLFVCEKPVYDKDRS